MIAFKNINSTLCDYILAKRLRGRAPALPSSARKRETASEDVEDEKKDIVRHRTTLYVSSLWKQKQSDDNTPNKK